MHARACVLNKQTQEGYKTVKMCCLGLFYSPDDCGKYYLETLKLFVSRLGYFSLFY